MVSESSQFMTVKSIVGSYVSYVKPT